MSPHKTGIEETEASFKKGKLTSLREQILYTYHNAEEIPEKTAFILLRIADMLEGKPKPAPVIEAPAKKEDK